MSFSDIGITSRSLTTSGPSWAAEFPVDTSSITLDADACLARYPDGVVPSGAVLGLVTATRRYAPYDNAFDADPATAGQQSDGRDIAAGHLVGAKTVRAGKHVDAALYYKGRIFADLLPANSGLDAAAQADLAGRIRYDRVGA
jgi:hypothetical protein